MSGEEDITALYSCCNNSKCSSSSNKQQQQQQQQQSDKVKQRWKAGRKDKDLYKVNVHTSLKSLLGGIGGIVDSEYAPRSAEILLSRVRAPPPALWPDGGPESLRSPCYGLAILKKPKPAFSQSLPSLRTQHSWLKIFNILVLIKRINIYMYMKYKPELINSPVYFWHSLCVDKSDARFVRRLNY
ncbi:hypothetical protein PoB_003260500 [Plakobranchus ocellatus]|uniref:Uncharacterized protein n=1 Tax=Plakobranchus ocellatus TaxID=259542 RepID=A0AAV4AD53_9GAST|nr:hypothetical protein PoB_003260500 [Plakobranchus ocellatus]